MPDLSWTASIDVTNVSKALSKIDREAKELGVSFDKTFRTADEAVKYLQENISGLETALVRLKKEQSDVKLLPDSEGRTERLKALKIEIDDVTTSLRQNKKWQQDLSKAQKEDVGNTNTQINSFRSLFTIFQAGTKTSHSLVGGFKAINAALKANPFGVVLLAAVAVVGVFKKLYNSLQPVKNLVDGISNAFDSLGTSIANSLGMETVSQHEAKIKQLEKQKEKLDELKESVSDLDEEIDRLKEKNKTPKQRLSKIDLQIVAYERIVNAYQELWDEKSPLWKENNSSGVLATRLEGAKKQLELAKLQRDEIKKEIDEADAPAKKSQAEEAERLKKQQEEIEKKIRAYNDRINALNYNAELDLRQREIDAMSETSAKEIAQLKLNHDKKLAEIEREKAEELSKYNAAYGTNVISYNDLPSFVRENLDPKFVQSTANAESEYNIGVEKVKGQLIGELSSFSAQLNKINAEYAKKKKEITENYDFALSESEIDVELKNITEQRNKEIDEVAKKAQTMFAKNASVWKDINNDSIKDLKSRIKDLKVLKRLYESKDRDEIEKLSKQLNLTEEQKEAIEAVKQSSNETTEAIETLNNGISKGIESEIEMLDDYVSVVQGLIDKLSDLASISNSTTGEGISNGLNALSNGINGFYKGQSTLASLQTVGLFSNMGAAAGGAIGIIVAGLTMIYENTMRVKQRNEEIKQSYKDIAEAINETKKEQELLTQQAENNTIFGSSKTSYRQAAEDLRFYKKNLSDIVSEYEKYSQSGRDSAYRATLSDSELISSHLDSINRNIGKGELIKDGKFNVEVAKDILEYETNLTDEARNYLTNLVNVFGGIEESERAMKEDLQSVFGSLGDTLANDLINAFSEGTDAGEAMAKSIKSMFLAETQKNISAEISSIYSKYSDELRNAIATEAYADDSALIDKMNSEINGIVDSYKNEVEWIKNLSGNNDVSISSSSSAKGITQASQDSIDDLNGRFTAIQSHTYSINENMKEMQTRQSVILNEIMGIHTDTSSLKTMFINGTARVKIN